MLPPRLELLRNADGRELRLVFELLSVALAAVVAFHLGVAPALRSAAPAVFDSAVAETGRGPPRTALGWVRGLLVLTVMGSYFYYRLYYTALGAQLQEKYLRSYARKE